jgi:hypothetical protein
VIETGEVEPLADAAAAKANCWDCPANTFALEGETVTPDGKFETVMLTLESNPLDPLTFRVIDPGSTAEMYRVELERVRLKDGGGDGLIPPRFSLPPPPQAASVKSPMITRACFKNRFGLTSGTYV